METQNPFGNATSITTPAHGTTAIADAAIHREIAEVQGAMILARKFPRDQSIAMNRILKACSRTTLAAEALYSYARGGTDITGPSIRMAETIAQNWQNLQFGIRELEQRNGESTVEAYAWDLETNVRQSKVFQVPHKRYTKSGSYALSDPRDIYETVANNGARRLRACILGIIPPDVVEAAVDAVEQTLIKNLKINTETINAMVDKFGQYGVSKAAIEKFIQGRIDSIKPAKFVRLRKIFNSIKDGMSTPADWFEVEQQATGQQKSGTDKAKDALKGKQAPKPAEPSDQPEALGTVHCPQVDAVIQASKCLSCPSQAGCPAL